MFGRSSNAGINLVIVNLTTGEDADALAQVATAVDVPIAAGEIFSTKYGFRCITEKKAADIDTYDILYATGITEWIKIAALNYVV